MRISDWSSDVCSSDLQGFFCVKAQGMVDVTNDPDRLVQPLRRTGSAGQFEPCSWEEALSDIAARLDDIWERHGPDVIAVQSGTPAYHRLAALLVRQSTRLTSTH